MQIAHTKSNGQIASNLAIVLTFVFAVSLLLSPGCSCRKSPTATTQNKKKNDPLANRNKKPEDDFEIADMDVLPSDKANESVQAQGQRNYVKPGHWFAATQKFKANKEDFLKGEFESFTARRNKDQRFDIRDTNFQLRVVRPAALPKGQSKTFDLLYFAPTSRGELKSVWLYNDLNYVGGTNRLMVPPALPNKLKPYQNFMIVLSREPSRYTFLKVMRSIKPPTSSFSTSGIISDYLVSLPKFEVRADLPTNPLAWSTFAYLIWDDFDGGLLSRDQQRALLDWLHWGGQLIVSGPDSLDKLKTSFLADFLPATNGEVYRLTEEAIAPLNQDWTIPSPKSLPLTLAGQPEEAIRLELREDGAFIDKTNEMIAERHVGLGRITVTGFRLYSQMMVNWTEFDNLFNNCILRRPPREYKTNKLGDLEVTWAHSIDRSARRMETIRRIAEEEANDEDEDVDPSDKVEDSYEQINIDVQVDKPTRAPYESLLTSKLRYFSRDALANATFENPVANKLDVDVSGYGYDRQAGVGGWNDNSNCGQIVRDVLTASGGIEVPNANFILGALGVYLLVLVPVNWVIFRAMDRVEWCWIAVPVIALIGTFSVVRLAQLDIGFARSRTEIAILETQPGYSRGHLTRFTGLYTSLSTGYELRFADSSALAMPFSTGQAIPDASIKAREIATLRLGDTVTEDEEKKRVRVRLQGISVSSNNTGMVHSEQMLDCKGPFEIRQVKADRYEIANKTAFRIRDIGLIARINGQVFMDWIGDMDADYSKTFEFSGRTDGEVVFEEWENSAVLKESVADGEISLRKLFELGLDHNRLGEGDFRIVGWTDQEMPGMSIHPAASQKTFRTVVVGNLKYGQFATPMSDLNSALSFGK